MSEPLPRDLVQRRAEIGDAMAAVERALATPSATGQVWRERVRHALERLDELVVVQMSAYLEPGAVLDDMVAATSRLAPRIDRARTDIQGLGPRLDGLLRALDSSDPEQIRADVVSFLGELVGLRQRIADLFYEAYMVDIGGVG